MKNPPDRRKESYNDFLNDFRETLQSVFYKRDELEKFILKRGFPALVLRDIMAQKPLSVAIPEEYGGRGTDIKECLGILEAASYESLPLSLIFGINIALFLEPVAKYAQPSIKDDLYRRFLNQQNMGGLMITEPDYGSDALNMQTYYTKKGSEYHISGTKHWQGLTGMADYWIITSRKKNEKGDLSRDIDFFICDVQQPGQNIQVEEYYNNIGLFPVPYGKNIVDVSVPEQNMLKPVSTGLKLMMDLLHRSRLQFPGMAMGFLRRILDEAIKQCNSRIVAGRTLLSLDQVQHQIAKIQSAFTVCSAMCSRSADISGIENNLYASSLEANSMKAYVTDLMQESAQTLTQLNGANGYKIESLGARGIVDSRPFQIFEGSNEMLYTQIYENVEKLMNKLKTTNLLEFFKIYERTENVAGHFKSLLNFSLDVNIPQRKMVDLGKIISKVIAAGYVSELGLKGFRQDLIVNSIENIKHEISAVVNSFKFQPNVSPVLEYNDKSSWLTF